jgi:LysM repeat protein
LVFLQRKRKKGTVSHHIVQKGESIYSICQTEGVRMDELLEYNLLKEGMEPAVGEKLYLQEKAAAAPKLQTAMPVAVVKQEIRETVEPARTEIRQQKHIVKEKETLYSIAKRYGTTVELIVQWNKLPGTQLKKGQELIIYNQ